MKVFVLCFVAAVLFLDAIVIGIYIHWIAWLLIIPAMLFLWGGLKSIQRGPKLYKNGLALLDGYDLETPDDPNKTNVVLEDRSINLGLLFLGGPGSGKSIAGINLLVYYTNERKHGWVYWDGKGDRDIYQSACAAGATPDRFFSSELPGTDTINAFAGPVDNVIDGLSAVLIITESEYYRNIQRAALRAAIPLLKALNTPVILRDLYVMMTNEEALTYVLNKAREQSLAPDIIEVAEQFFSRDRDKLDNDINGLVTRLSLFVTGHLAERLNAYQPTLDLVQAAAEGQRVFLHLPYTQIAKDIAILLTEQIGTIAKNRQLFESNRTPWPQMFDDWGAFFYPNFGPITARCRSAKMPISFLFQSKGQTDRVESGNHFTTEMTDNIGGMILLRINGQDTAEWAARQFGMYETHELNQTENNTNRGSNLSTHERPRLRGDQLKNLNAGQAYISCLVAGEGGVMMNKRYKARFPLPAVVNPGVIDWPAFSHQAADDETEGLHLWRDFMNADRLSLLKKKIVDDVMAETAVHRPIDKVNYL